MHSTAYVRLRVILLMAMVLPAIVGRSAAFDNWEEVGIVCPTHCVCQRAHLRDLSIGRWTSGQQAEDASATWHLAETNPAHNHNEVEYGEDEGENTNSDNPFLRQAMCMLPDKGNVKDVLLSLPPDVQALVLLYNNGADKNITVRASDLLELSALTVLELRATHSQALHFLLDEPLKTLRYANFETVALIGTRSPAMAAAISAVHPSELFDYVPESERAEQLYNISMAVDAEPVIVPYEVYEREQRMAKMATFAGWQELRVLRVHGCRLDELHWQMFDGLQRLEHLSLAENGIKIVPAFALFGAPLLRTLSLAHNEIFELNYRALAGLLRLERLDLSDNRMEHLSELTFPPFPRLRTLDIRGNPVRMVLPMTFGVMNATKHVLIGSPTQAFELSTEEVFRSLGALRTLRIENAQATVLSQSVFRGLRSVESLRLQGNVRRIEFDAFAEMVSVRELVLSGCGLEALSMDTFFGTRDLEVIDLSANRLAVLPPGLFDGQTKLKEVYLQENRLTELPGDIFRQQSLKLLRLIENPWNCMNCANLQFWRQPITNAVRQGRTNQRCVHDMSLAGGTRVRCTDNRNQFEYGYDAKMTPRCGTATVPDAIGRDVYYTMRKTLRCVTPMPTPKNAVTRTIVGGRVRQAVEVGAVSAVAAAEHMRQQLVQKKRRAMLNRQNDVRFQLRRQRHQSQMQMQQQQQRGQWKMSNDL